MKIAFSASTWVRGFGLALMLLMGVSAAAQGIVYVTPQQPTYYSVFYPGILDFAIDINGDGTTDFILRSNDSGSSVNNAFLIPQGNNAVVSMNSYVANMSNGNVVGSSLAPIYQWSNTKMPISAVALLLGPQPVETGNFVGQSSGYIGFDVVLSGANYYGWIQISSPNNDAAIYGDVLSWAYESAPNNPITVGAVPEPGTWALFGIGSFALLVLQRKSEPVSGLQNSNQPSVDKPLRVAEMPQTAAGEIRPDSNLKIHSAFRSAG